MQRNISIKKILFVLLIGIYVLCLNNNVYAAEYATCTYKGMNGGGTIKIVQTSDRKYDVTLPNNEIVTVGGAMDYIYRPLNVQSIMPSTSCEDIFYSEKDNIIVAIPGGSYGESESKTICHQYPDAEQFCVNGNCNVTNVICGNSGDSEYGTCPSELRPAITFIKRAVINTLKIFVPIILILMGTIDMTRAVMSNDDKGLHDATGRFIRRIIIALVFFFVSTLVSLVISQIAKTTTVEDSETWKACWNEIG